MGSNLITLTTDFGTHDAYVGIMKGVMLGINPAARLVDLTHEIAPQQVVAAALVLRHAVAFFPAGTVHLVVVDPGVGSARRAIVIEAVGGVLVGPDNGVLCPAADALGRRTPRLIDNQRLLRNPVSRTFHGRDVFAPVAAHLSRGVPPESVGPGLDTIEEIILPRACRTEAAIIGEVLYVDRFGNLITNIEEEAIRSFSPHRVSVSIGDRRVVGPVEAYAAVPEGTPVAIVGSWGALEIAVRNGNAAVTFAAGPGAPVTVVRESRDV